MRRALVTGSEGFVGRNLRAALRSRPEVEVLRFDLGVGPETIRQALEGCDTVFHLAGANRPADPSEFQRTNADLTLELCRAAAELGTRPLVVFSSSIQAERDNPYGASKLAAENHLMEAAEAGVLDAAVFRLGNLFGKWSRPDYNSVVATFCHRIARDEPIEVHDPDRELELVYIDDVVDAFLRVADERPSGLARPSVPPTGRIRLGELADRIRSFRALRRDLWLPDFSDPLTHRLYATYLSYLPKDAFDYPLSRREDSRGVLAEFVKSAGAGQIFVSRTKPGAVRGNHHHRTKTEKFLVLEGQAVVRFRHIDTGERVEVRVRGEDLRPIDIPPGYTHCIQNVGDRDLVTLFWASEPFDPERPDTTFEEVGP
ncbi:MAG: NAD-dependent epimerase/dehydratase family protein [Fimbriimonadales bacterium]|nr:NAD-dependent epimerase/dehydratase family protein [Fimbriimonadales bacterium]